MVSSSSSSLSIIENKKIRKNNKWLIKDFVYIYIYVNKILPEKKSNVCKQALHVLENNTYRITWSKNYSCKNGHGSL